MDSQEIKKSQIANDDNYLVKMVLSGSNEYFDKLQIKYKPLIRNLIRKMVKDADDIEDLLQDTFIKAFNALSTFQEGYSFSSWIYRIASNTTIDFLRKKRFPTVSIDQPVNNDDDDYYIQIEDKGNRPDIDVMAQERKNALLKAIDELPDNYRQIIKMRHEDELEYNQIAEILGIPLGTVKAHLFRSRKLLFAKLKKDKHLFVDL